MIITKDKNIIIGIIVSILILTPISYSIFASSKTSTAKKEFSYLGIHIDKVKSQLTQQGDFIKICDLTQNIEKLILQHEKVNHRLSTIENNKTLTALSFNDITSELVDITKITISIDELLGNLNSYTSNAIEKSFREADNSLRNSTSISQVKNIVQVTTTQLEKAQSCMNQFAKLVEKKGSPTVFPNLSRVNYNLAIQHSETTKHFFTSGVIATERINGNQLSTYVTEIKSARNVSAMHDTYKKYLSSSNDNMELIGELILSGADQNRAKSTGNEVQRLVNMIKADIKFTQEVIDKQTRSGEIMKNALLSADRANSRLNQLEKFAHSDQILEVYREWDTAHKQSQNALTALNMSQVNDRQIFIHRNLMTDPKNNVTKIVNQINGHKTKVWNAYGEARQQESTMIGQAQRTAGRLINRAVQTATQSRIGREISIGVKTLILGTKAFYDLMEPDTNVLTWAMSYEKDINQLSREADAVSRMSGPSLTGKNTFIERLANDAYSASFQ